MMFLVRLFCQSPERPKGQPKCRAKSSTGLIQALQGSILLSVCGVIEVQVQVSPACLCVLRSPCRSAPHDIWILAVGRWAAIRYSRLFLSCASRLFLSCASRLQIKSCAAAQDTMSVKPRK